MFAIAVKAEQYPTYLLSDTDADAKVTVVPQRGGLITHWQINDQDILYFDAERFANPELSVRGGIPILFPICGNLPDHTYTLEGQAYSLKQHGFARDLPWQVLEQSVRDSAALTLALTSNDHTRALYPFDFRLELTYRLQGHTLTLDQRVINASDRPMPFSLGLHPYFHAADKTQLRFDLPAQQLHDQLTQAVEPFAGHFDLSQPEIDVALTPLSAQTATVVDHHSHRALTLTWSDTYSALVFWTVQGKPYYCLEPWTALRNALNTGDRIITLAPGATHEATVALAVAASP
ncbi:Aldose-1-epimerase [Halomicronema hongdechloris C2206]|uniref:Aldose-1-epimerase n=1 Tax=Halomicronema hongdechloris C2206 TaxID=1641165 RepID=A0A1Z3HIF6_9CYAN|nr:aldose epimerase [Halomicronema hongdechloris]ASC70085.1 Aldose-1-epimerase [Halomicronema hongdechloris C2206]